MKQDALKVLGRIRDYKLQQCDIKDRLFWEWATESAKDEFSDNFEAYNNWIHEDEFATEQEWESAKKEFAQEIINEFK